jgi:hypothetical protein
MSGHEPTAQVDAVSQQADALNRVILVSIQRINKGRI